MPELGVCSWSLRPGGPEGLAGAVRACGVGAVQLALDPIREGAWDEDQTRRALEGVCVLSGMMTTRGEDYSTLESIRRTGGVRPDEHWDENRRRAEACAGIARRWGIGLVTLHAGFLPHEPGDAERGVLIARLRELREIFAGQSVRLGLETGQESARTLVGVLEELNRGAAGEARGVGVNFDPANMILYGMGEPVAALERLSPWVVQVHIKDAVAADVPGQWGREVPMGRGQVDWPGFFGVLRRRLGHVNLVIEREAGESRVEDVRHAAEQVRRRLAEGGA